MCWSQEVSWTTFILGTIFNIFNILYFKDTTITLISIGIEWLLLMQFFEALAWRDQECGYLNKFATNGALIANITQPIFVGLLFILFTPVSIEYKAYALCILFGYIMYSIYVLNNSEPYTCLKPGKDCYHLDLHWWKNMNGLIYCATLFAIILLLIRPLSLAIATSGYIAVTLITSIIFYSCSVGSMWCWFTSFAPIFLAIFYNIVEK